MGETIGRAVLDVLKQWLQVENFVAGLCLVTTASNMGVHSGACTVIQNAIGKPLHFMAYGNITSMSYFSLASLTYSPPPLAQKSPYLAGVQGLLGLSISRFSNHLKFMPVFPIHNSSIRWISKHQDELASFIITKLWEGHDCHDYREYLELSLRFLSYPLEERKRFD